MTDLVPSEKITAKICLLRNRKVMLDRDLAELYGVEVRVLKQAVRRNRRRFPDDFMFETTREEEDFLRSQTVTIEGRGRHSKYLSFAFTEQGVAMLSSVLKSNRAIEVNIAIMRAFVEMRQIMSDRRKVAERINELEKRLTGHDENFQVVFEAIRQLLETEEKPKRKIGF